MKRKAVCVLSLLTLTLFLFSLTACGDEEANADFVLETDQVCAAEIYLGDSTAYSHLDMEFSEIRESDYFPGSFVSDYWVDRETSEGSEVLTWLLTELGGGYREMGEYQHDTGRVGNLMDAILLYDEAGELLYQMRVRQVPDFGPTNNTLGLNELPLTKKGIVIVRNGIAYEKIGTGEAGVTTLIEDQLKAYPSLLRGWGAICGSCAMGIIVDSWVEDGVQCYTLEQDDDWMSYDLKRVTFRMEHEDPDSPTVQVGDCVVATMEYRYADDTFRAMSVEPYVPYEEEEPEEDGEAAP